MQVAEGKAADELQVSSNSRSVLAGKADHDVGAEGQLGAGGVKQGRDFLGVVPGPVAAVHAAQHGVGAGLQRQVRMAGEAGAAEFAHQSDEIGDPSPWARWS